MSESVLTLLTAEKSWANLDSILVTEIRKILRTSPNPWQKIKAVPKLVEQVVMNVLQNELDVATPGDQYFTVCMKSLRALSEERDIFPDSFQCVNIIKKGELPYSGGGSADVWKGEMEGRPVCLKVLRIFTSSNQVEKFLKQLRREAIVWRQLRHENILPFFGVNSSYFQPRHCLISPWMKNGSLISFLELHPHHNRLKCVRDTVNAVEFMHSLDPQVIHGDIRGCNILVTEDNRCCLADFGASIITSTMAPSTNTMSHNSTPWMAPEFLEYSSKLYNQSLLAGRDIYALGCTIVEIFTLRMPFSHIHRSAIMNAKIEGIPYPRPSPEEFPSNKLWILVEECMAKDPMRRPNAKSIKQRLDDA